jgi:hypothetical protein
MHLPVLIHSLHSTQTAPRTCHDLVHLWLCRAHAEAAAPPGGILGSILRLIAVRAAVTLHGSHLQPQPINKQQRQHHTAASSGALLEVLLSRQHTAHEKMLQAVHKPSVVGCNESKT